MQDSPGLYPPGHFEKTESNEPDPAAAVDQAESLKQVVAESLAANEAAPRVPVRRRGRKKGSVPWNKGLSSIPTPTEANGSVQPADAAGPPAEPVEIPAAVLKPALQMPFQIAARKTGFDGFKLSDDEAEELAPMVGTALQKYFPSVGGEHAAAMTLAGSIALLAVVKYLAYLDFKAEGVKPPTKENPDAASSEVIPSYQAGAGPVPAN